MRLMKMPSVDAPCPFPLSELQLRFNRIKLNYWELFASASSITTIPIEILVAKSAVESAGLQQTNNPFYVGLMQIGKLTIQDTLNFLCGALYADGKKWIAPDWLTNNALPIVRKYLPTFYPGNTKSFNPQTAFAIAGSNAGAEFNVLMGSVYLFFLMHNPKFIDNNVVRLDKVMSGYNTGPNLSLYAPRAKAATADTIRLINTIKTYPSLSSGKKKETTAHILKFTGINGAFDLVFNKGILNR